MRSASASVALVLLLAGAGLVALERRPGPTPAEAPALPEAETAAAAEPAAPAPEVILYVSEACGLACRRQQQELDGLGIQYRVRAVDREAEALRALRRHDRDATLPSITLHGRLWRGYDVSNAWSVLHALRYRAGTAEPVGDDLVLFTRSDCEFSAKLREELDALGVAYANRLVDADQEALSQLVRLVGEARVPVAVWRGELWSGWSEEHAPQIRRSVARGGP